MNVLKYYGDLVGRQSAIVAGLALDQNSLESFTSTHNYLMDYELLRAAIDDRPEKDVMDVALKEYQFSLLALASGQYRYAFGGLRLFFELMLSVVRFSAHEIDLRMWMRDSKDINWDSLKNLDSGVFSINFLRAFNPAFAEFGRQFSAISESVYRECSEYVHGNARTHTMLPSDIKFDCDAHLAWCDKSAAMRQAIVFAFAARYLNYVSADRMMKMESVVMDVIGYLAPVQVVFEKSCED